MSATAISKNNVIICLAAERRQHIAEQHGELIARKVDVLRTVENPAPILAGGAGELLATREFEPGK
jgi:hypothetical protein